MALTKAYGKDDMGKLLIEQLSVGMLPTNCYVLHLEDSTQAVVVDPGDQGAEIAEHLKGQGLTVSAVLLTHGHFDHIYGVKALKEATGTYVAAPEAERELLLDPAENLSLSFGHSVTLKADRYLADGEVFEEAGIRFMTIATPGHTAGSTSYFIDGEKPVLLMADARLVVQVLINLVNNAIAYTPKGTEIRISADTGLHEASITVADNGPGIPDGEKERVFEMFYSGSGNGPENRRSVGMGLSLCRAIVQAHGGEILLRDNIPSGAAFTFTLPLSEVDVHE